MKIRIVNLDFYMSNSLPNLDILYSEFRGSTINHVPVIRIYGSTEEGEKICLHIHRVFPYIYIPYDDHIAGDGFLYQVASALDKAINLSLGQASSNVQHVYKICLVSGIPIYGYHTRSHQFLKLYFYNPLIVKKACTLLQNGSILGKVYQPHEAHIPYILQFMIDYNLHGMSFIHLADLKYRSDKYSHEKYPGNSILPPSIRKMSVCKIEADTTADCILNREEIKPGQLTANPGIRVLWEDEEQRRRNNGESSQIEHCLTQNRLDVPQTATHVAYKKLLDDKLRMKPKSSEVSPQLEQSVYPAETPPSSGVLDASIIENHIFSSQNTDDSSVLDETITENLINDLTLDEDAQKLFDLLQNLKEDNVEKDSILSQVPKEQDSDEEEQDLSLPLNATQTPCKLEETGRQNTDDYLNDSYFESIAKIPQLDGACDDLSMENKQKPKRGRKKHDIEKKTSEAFQPTVPKAKKLDGTASGKKGRGRKITFRVKTSAILYKSRSKYSTSCQHCENNNNNSSTSNKKGSPCIKHYFGGLLRISNVITSAAEDFPKNEDHKEIESDIEKAIEGICQDINKKTENKEACNREVLKVEDKHGGPTKYLKSELQDSILDGTKVSTKVEDADVQDKSKTRSKRKTIPVKRLLEETPQMCPSNQTRKFRNSNLSGKTKDRLAGPSNCKTCENQVKLTKKSKANGRTSKKASTNKLSFKGDNLTVKATILQKPETLRNVTTKIEIVSRKQQERNNDKEIDSDIEEAIKDICQDINEETTSSADPKNKGDQIEESNAEVLKIEDKYRKSTKTLDSELQDSTVDRAKVSYQIKNIAYVQEIAKPIDQNSVESDGKSKARNKRKSIPTKRLLEGTSQKCPSNFSRKSRNTSFKRKTKDVLTGSSSDCKICRNRDKSAKTAKTNEKIAKYTKQAAIQSKDELTITIMDNISKTERNNHGEIDSDIEKVIKDICQDISEEKTPSSEILEIFQNWSKATKTGKDIEGLTEGIRLKETTNTSSLSEEDMKIKSLKHEADIAVAEILKISQDLQNLRKSNDSIEDEFGEPEKVVNSKSLIPTLGGINVLDQITKAEDIEEFVSKPADQNPVDYNRMLKAKNKRKPDRVNETPQKCASNSRKLRNCKLNSLHSYNCKSYEDQDTSAKESKISRSKITQQKAIMTKKTLTITGNVSDLLLKKCDILKKNVVEPQTAILQKSGSIDSVTVSITNNVQFTKQKANRNPSEGIQITSPPEETKQLQEEMESLVTLQDNKSEKLDMPELFDSFSNEYDQNLDSNVQNGNNNAQINSFHAYFSTEELPHTVEDAIKNDESYKPLKKRKYSLESIETPQIVLQDRKFEESQMTQLVNEDQVPRRSVTQSKVSRDHSDDSDKYNLRSTDVGDKLKLGKSEKLKRLLKNKRTQTENIFKVPRRPKGRPLRKPVLNFVLTRTQKKDEYKVRTYAANRKYVPTHDLGPNPRPKFKIVPANKPYTFEPKKNAEGNYPNTTWIKCIEFGRVPLDYFDTADIHSEKAVIISNRLLEGDQKFEHSDIKKGRVVDVIQPKKLKELSEREVINVKLQNSETLSLGERKNVDTFVNLYDDIKLYLFESNASPRSVHSSSSGGFSISKVLRSIGDGDVDPKEESEDKTLLETSNIVISNPPSNQVDGANIPTSLSNYRQDMKKYYDNLMEKLQRSFDNLFNSTTSITAGRSISSRLMLENLNGHAREDESKILIKRPFEGIQKDTVNDAAKVTYSSIDKNSGDKRKTLTLPEYYKQIKVKCFEKSDHTFTLKVELAKKPQGKDDGIETPKNSGKLLESSKLKPPASQRTISTPKDSMFLRSTHASLPTNKFIDIYSNVLGPCAVQNKYSDAPKLEFNNNQNYTVANSVNQKLAPPTTLKTSFSCNFEYKEDLLPRNSKRSKGKTVKSENSSNILAKNENADSEKGQYKPKNLHNYALRSSSIKTYETRSFAFENNPSEDLNLLRNTPNSPERLKNYETPPSTSETPHWDNFECKAELFQRNSKEIKDKTRTSKITPRQIKRKEFVGTHRSSEILNRSIVSRNSKNNCKAKISSIVNPCGFLKQSAYCDIDQYNRGKNLEMKEDTSAAITHASRSGKNELHRSFDDSKRIKTSFPENTGDLISRSKSGTVSITTPSYSSLLQESTKPSKKKKKSKKKNKLKRRIDKEPIHEILGERSNYSGSTRAIVSPSKSKSSCVSKSKFKKPKYLIRIPIHSIPKHLQNPEDVLAVLLKNSEPINHKKDIDERAIKYNLLKQKLELARTTEHPTLNSKIRKDCLVHLARYNFINMWGTRKRTGYKQDTTCSIQDSNMNTYVADMNNNNSKMSLEVGSTVGKGSKRKIKKKRKMAEEDEITPYPVNQYNHLDGPNDSSSDDEKVIKPTAKKRCRQAKKGFSQSVKYSPLKVNFRSPTKPNLQKQAIPRGEDAKDTSKCQPQPKYKRKLSFSENISLNRTEIEERLMCTYKSKEKAQLKSMRKDLAPVVQDKVPQFSTEDNLKLDTQNEFDTILITPYQKVRTTMQIQHNKIVSETDENKTNQNAISQEQNIFTPLITLNCPNIVQSATQPPVPKQFFASLERISPNMPRESQKNVDTSSQKLLQTKLVEQNRDIQIESGPSLLTPYQKQFRNMKGESQNILSTALITPYKKEYSTLSQNDPQVYLDDTQLSSSSASLSDDIFSPNMPNSFSSEVFTPIEDKNEEIDRLERQALDPAELYDEKNKYIPQAGTSKFTDAQMLTQISESSDEISTPKPISLNSNGSIFTENELKLSADSGKDSEKSSEIDPVAPYQKENVGFEVGEGLCKSKIESSGSEITPYQKEQNLHRSDLILTTCLNIFEFADQNLPSGNGCKIIVPKFQPPSRDFIEATMQEFNIPMESHQEPFYSDAKDVTGPMEVGVRILKIPSNKIVDITEFESSFKGINCYRKALLEHMYPNEKITNRDIYNYKMSFCKSTNCIIIPAKLPPSREDVEMWLKSKLEKKQKILKVIARKKIIIPCSPGADNDSDDSLTVSPCTSLDETLKNVRKITEDETSKSSLDTIFDNTSTIIKKNDSLKCHRKGISPNSSLKSNQSSENTFNSQELDTTKQRRRDSCQITGVTLDRTNNFAISCDNLQNAKAVSEYLHLTVFSMELIIETRNDYKPNPSHDAIKGIVYQIFNDVPEDDLRKRSVKGCFLLNNMPISPTRIKFSIVDGIVINNDETIRIFETETDMMTKFVEFLVDCDPDILVGYEIQMLSWGYLIERGYSLNLNLISLLSRVPQSTKSKPEDDLSDLTIPGRIILDFWRLLRHEIALQSYTFENIVYHILHQRVPLYSFRNITFWWNHVSGLYRNKVLRYYFYRVEAILRIMDQLDLIGRTSELAKLFGIQFFEVLSRGSQFRVESMMLRLAKPLNYIPVSPSVQQRANMRAPESLPLIMEPESKFYVDPVIVLDFQSLYPSMIIAYNYCFSTCLGRIEHVGHDIPFEFGATQLKVPRKYIKRLSRKDLINISPCGVGFVKKTVREGILPRMLQEILDTRLMVKKSLKKNAGNKTLEKVLDARQLGLKLIANVTYGYTAANFSGRMPCIEVGDSVVSKGRETLQRAINLVEKTPKWGAKVVYGDTDSVFVLVPGKSRQEAFKIGAEIAEAVTNANPSPVKLKLEKVFHPCILQTKKRYVGYMYESPEQDEPEYLAKGIETVRRDGCPAVAKMLEKCLKILFDTRDISLVRQYVVRQFSKILSGRISIQDLTFAKEYRGASSYRPAACVPALELTRKWLAVDKRNEPRRGERVPYVIVNGPPGLPLIRLVRCPRELIADPALRPNALYYITKVIIPPINRCFLLIGADVNNWFNDMPRKQYQYLHSSSPVKGKKSTISQYFSTKNCVICGLQSKDGICEICLSKPQNTSAILHEKARVLEQNFYETKMICESCCGTSDKVTCISLDCPVYYKRIQTEKEVQQTPFIRELISLLPNLDF